MAKAIILYKYNKYYNRIIKRLDTFEDYQSLITSQDNGITPPQYRGLLRKSFNFDFADGVHASKVLQITEKEDIYFRTEHPDYMVIEEDYNAGTVEEPQLVKKLTRWFVLDLTRLRGMKYRLSLRRDLLADYFGEITTSPCFIERGIPSVSDPAIFNREGFTYNQIKKGEFLLNNTKLSGKGKGWIVGYMAQQRANAINATGHQSFPVENIADLPDYDDLPTELKNLITAGTGYRVATPFLMDVCYRRFTSNWSSTWEYKYLRIEQTGYNGNTARVISEANLGSGYAGYIYFWYTPSYDYYSSHEVSQLLITKFRTASQNNSLMSKVDDWFSSLNLQNRFYSSYLSYNGMYVKKNGKAYKITVSEASSPTYQDLAITKSQVNAGSSALALWYKNYMASCFSGQNIRENEGASNSSNVVRIRKPQYKTTFKLTEVDFKEITTTIPTTSNENLEAPYDLFCIPMGEIPVKRNGSVVFTHQENEALAIARGIKIAGETNIFDIQVLPYCPYPDIIDSDGNIDLTGFTENKDFCYIKQTVGGTSYNIGIIVFPLTCRGTFDLDIPSDSDLYEKFLADNSSNIIKKIKAETEFARFVSPNFSAMFDINIQKNEGIEFINVDYFYKPYSPYIHVAPYFSGLYGEDYNDPKGLICSGDFSISTAQDQWELYQVQNKNYELIFNRQIANLDINNSIAYEQMELTGKLGIASSVMQGATSGAITGGMTGNPYVAAAGALIGGAASGITSAIGAQKDLEYLSRSQQEARSYMQDMYTYNLGNIQALPQSLTKVSSLTENNKIFPFIEFYECTEEEKEALRNKIIYNGMTIMRIGTIIDFVDADLNYVQGQLIRLLGLDEDNHVVSEIAKEIKMGAYYYGTNPSST